MNELLLAQNVQPKAVTPGVAQEPASPPSSTAAAPSPSPLASMAPLLMMALIFVPFFYLMSRRQKKEAQARAGLRKGDRVMTNAGLIGELVEMDDRVARIKVAPSVTLQVVANTVSPYAETEKGGSKELKDARPAADKK